MQYKYGKTQVVQKGGKKNQDFPGRRPVTKIFEKMVGSRVIVHAEHDYLGFERAAEIIAQSGAL